MKRMLQALAVLVVIGVISTWFATGAHRGWTKTRVQVKTVDDVTGLEDIRWLDKFEPGVDFLGAGVLGAGVLAGVSLIFRKKPNTTQTTDRPT